MLKDEADKATWELQLYTWEHLQSESMWADFGARRDVEAKLRKETERILRRHNIRKQDERTVDRKETEDKVSSKKKTAQGVKYTLRMSKSNRYKNSIIRFKFYEIKNYDYEINDREITKAPRNKERSIS